MDSAVQRQVLAILAVETLQPQRTLSTSIWHLISALSLQASPLPRERQPIFKSVIFFLLFFFFFIFFSAMTSNKTFH